MMAHFHYPSDGKIMCRLINTHSTLQEESNRLFSANDMKQQATILYGINGKPFLQRYMRNHTQELEKNSEWQSQIKQVQNKASTELTSCTCTCTCLVCLCSSSNNKIHIKPELPQLPQRENGDINEKHIIPDAPKQQCNNPYLSLCNQYNDHMEYDIWNMVRLTCPLRKNSK
jgi:hypothetical protein